MAKRTLYPLYVQSDAESVRPILDALQKKGFSVDASHTPKKNDTVLFFLSENMQGDAPEIDEFLRLDAQKLDVIPVSLDSATPPALIESAIMARHTIFADRYTADELIDRIASAAKKPAAISSKMWKWIVGAAAVVLLAVVGLVLWRVLGSKKTDETVAEATPAPTAQPTPVPYMPGDIPPEDITKIIEITFIGDTYRWYTTDDRSYKDSTFSRGYNDFSYRYWDGDDAHWLSKEDGHEFTVAHYDDLSWLASLPNLKYVTFCAVAAEVPDLSGLSNLVGVYYCDNRIGTLEWLRGSTLHFIEYHGSDVADFSPLSDCRNFNSAYFDLVKNETADFSGFYPPSLRWIHIDNGHDLRTVDLSGLNRCGKLEELYLQTVPIANDFSLSGCKALKTVEIVDLPLRSLSFLSDCTALENLRIVDMTLNSLDGVENLKKLLRLELESITISDISAVAGCTALEEFNMGGYAWNENLRSLDVLGTLPKLRRISTHTANISDLNFLKEMKIKDGVSLHFSSNRLTDFSGLASIRSFSDTHFNLNGRDFSALILPYVQDATFADLNLYDCRNVDLSTLPKIMNGLTITKGDLTSLEGLNQSFNYLKLENCQYLTSLNGLNGLTGFGNGKGALYVEGCPRLVDWSALDGLRLNRMEFMGTYALPDFSKTNARFLRFDRVDEDILPDLSCLNGLDKTQMYDLDLAGQQNLTDLLPLFSLMGGHLVVPPQLGEQAQELVDTKRFVSFEVSYPDGNWEPDTTPIVLLSLDELETLPKTVLKKVSALNMAGDTIYDPEQYWVDEQWEDGNHLTMYLVRNGSDEREKLEYGTMLTDLSVLKGLTGLKELQLYCQPLETLDGIQYLESLENLELKGSETITNVSAAFALQNLRGLDLHGTSVTSLEGIQNLYHLEWLNMDGLEIDDLSPIAELNENVEILINTLPLMTYEDFCNLPATILNSVDRISISGDYVFIPWQNYWFEVDWQYNPPRYFIHDDNTNTRKRIELGSLNDLQSLPEMRRLKTLCICAQPITSLEGAERLPDLVAVEVQNCSGLTDISLLFNLPEIQQIRLWNTEVDSIEGVQNLKKLTQLTVARNRITDISPLAEIDYSYCMEPDEGGWTPYFQLEMEDMSNDIPPEQFQVLSAIPYFRYLDIDWNDYRLWADVLKDAKIEKAQICDCNWDNEGFRTFIEQHPELEEIDLRWNPKLTDLTPLYSLPNLHWIIVSKNMRAAQNSLSDERSFGMMVED